MDIQGIIKSPEYSMLLLKIYSKHYLNGGQPRTCENSQKQYFEQIKKDKNNIMKIEKNKKERTCIPSFSGDKRISQYVKNGVTIKIFRNVNSENLTDQEAIDFLEAGILKESDFEKLPEVKKTRKSKKTIKK